MLRMPNATILMKDENEKIILKEKGILSKEVWFIAIFRLNNFVHKVIKKMFHI